MGYTATNVAYGTVNADLETAKKAVTKALEQLGLKPSGPVTTDRGARFFAIASDLEITVLLKRITPKATKIFVDANAGFMQKDPSTAAEIIRHTAANLRVKK